MGQAIGIDRQILTPIEGVNRYRYAIPQPIDIPIGIFNRLLSRVCYVQSHTPRISRIRNFCKFCTPVAQYPGYGYALLKIKGAGTGTGTGTTFVYLQPTSVCPPHHNHTRENLPGAPPHIGADGRTLELHGSPQLYFSLCRDRFEVYYIILQVLCASPVCHACVCRV